MIKKKRAIAKVKERGGKIKSGRPTTTLSPRKLGKMTQGLGSMIKHSCLYSEQANALPF